MRNGLAEAGRTRSALGRLWRIGRWLLLGSALVWLGLIYLAQPGVLLPSHLASPMRTSDTAVHIRLAGEDYCLPVNYLDAPLDRGLDQQHMLLVALLPDLEARNRENWEEMLRTRGFGRSIRMLIRAVGDPVAHLAHRHQSLSSRLGPFVRIGQAFGLVVMATDERARRGRWELYLPSPGDSNAGFIPCVFPDDARSPDCRHSFVVGERFVVTATYGRAFLSEWQTIAERIEHLFAGFRTATDCRGNRPASP